MSTAIAAASPFICLLCRTLASADAKNRSKLRDLTAPLLSAAAAAALQLHFEIIWGTSELCVIQHRCLPRHTQPCARSLYDVLAATGWDAAKKPQGSWTGSQPATSDLLAFVW